MLDLLQTIVLATVLFVATNADDLVLLMVFFAQPGCRPRAIVLGQLVGLAVLTGVSFAAAWLALAAPPDWLPWLGLAPLALGLRWLAHPHTEEAPTGAASWRTVSVVMIANGADNLGAYIPAFAIQTFAQKVITAAAFGVLAFAWCALAWAAVRHPTWGPFVRRWSTKLGPFVLIGIGLWIIAHHPVFELLR
ncbi:MAG: cadmium resistance transporter [Opitutaceae bacterium]|nr:cadmium resistance transporter [Opitutaceae bacterium]